MTLGIVQSNSSNATGAHTSLACTLPGTPTNGNTLCAIITKDGILGTITTPAGWTLRQTDDNNQKTAVFTKVAGAAESPTVTITFTSTTLSVLTVFETAGAFGAMGAPVGALGGTSNPRPTPSVTPTAGLESLLVSAFTEHNAYSVATPPSGYTALDEDAAISGSSLRLSTYHLQVPVSSGSYSTQISYANGLNNIQTQAFLMWFVAAAPGLVANFTGTPLTGDGDTLVTFTDTSTNSPTSWLWDFGDGDMSTSQNPVHIYEPGTYTVSLTATGPGGPLTETKVAYISILTVHGEHGIHEDVLALLEIYVTEPGGPKWDEARWDEAFWAAKGWQDVTPEGISATIRWGSHNPQLGILSTPDAGSWGVDIYDPDRILDPSNLESPYYGELKPGLPIRLSHISRDADDLLIGGMVVRQGIVESIGHSFMEPRVSGRGYIRATDKQALLSQADVPSDTTLSDTLYARARDAIAAAGLTVTVLDDPPTGDVSLAPWVTGTEWTAWQWIADAAQQVLHIPYIDRLGNLGFRAWAVPLNEGKSIELADLIDLQVISDYDGQYSVVEAQPVGGGALESAVLTPPPAYGKRVYRRTEDTPNAEDWAQAVLADRALPSLRWLPGQIYPLSAAKVRYWALLEAVELVDIAGLTDALIVGGEIRVTAKRDDAADWRFRFEAAQTAEQPLYVDGSDPPEYLYAETGDVYLYPDR